MCKKELNEFQLEDDEISANDVKVCYLQPAGNWMEALPVGNGRLGAMVFGKVRTERIQLNDDTIFAGEKTNRNNPKSIGESGRGSRFTFCRRALAHTLEHKEYKGGVMFCALLRAIPEGG